MGAPVYIGDELTGAGFALAGARALSPPVAETAAVLDEVLATRPAFVLLGARWAKALPAGRREDLAVRSRPPVLLVEDIQGLDPPPDLAERMRRRIGLAGG